MRWCFLTLLAAIVITPVFLVQNVFAQSEPSCGTVIIPAGFYYEGSEEFSDPINDCSNPLSRTGDLTTFRLNSESVQNNVTYTVAEEGTDNYGIGEESFFQGSGATYYKHNGQDLIRINTNYYEPVESDIKTVLRFYFNNNESQVQKYTEIYLADYRQPYFYDDTVNQYYYDSIANDFVWRVFAFAKSYIEQNMVTKRPALLPGTYTVVQIDTDEGFFPTYETNLIQKMFASIVATVYAYYNVNTVTFTLAGPVPEPTGASSVLFLPGIQASRLYKNGLLGTEDQLWEPNINSDVEKLAMTTNGMSENTIYTRDMIDELAVPGAGTNIYKGFINFMDNLVETQKTIKAWTPFAYDWRYDVDTIAKNGTEYESEVKNLVSEVERLAEDSYTDKVTVIGHSNGGLLGKLLISELARMGKADLVDKLVMIGTPQLGAPKAMLVMLHGFDQRAVFGLVINDSTARDVIRNLPGTYGLLPSAEYFAKTNDVLISTDNSNTTASIRTYGAINSETLLKNFLLDASSQRESIVPINEPSTLNAYLYQNALSTKNKLDSWLPPPGVVVYEVVGTGNPTIKSVQYQEFPCRFGTLACPTGYYMKAVPTFTDKGDETVPTISASGQDGDKITGYIDIYKEGIGVLNNRRTHMDLTESLAVQNFVESIINYPYVAENFQIPSFVEVSRSFKVIGVHSPVSLKITDSSGRQSGMIGETLKEDIPGSEYYELGDSKYIIIPDTVAFEATVSGEVEGVYSLTIDTLQNNTQTPTYRYMGASTTPNMIATFSYAPSGYSTIKTDTNGDGSIDVEQSLNGQIVLPPVTATYDILKSTIVTLKLPKLLTSVLLAQVDIAKHWDARTLKKASYQKFEFGALDILKATLKIYRQKRIITTEQYSSLEVIINKLRL